MNAGYTGHERIDQRSIALHRAIAEKIEADPTLLSIARDNLDRWALAAQIPLNDAGRSRPYADAWREILDRPLPELLHLLTEDSERMRALRQATPFAGVLNPAERWAIYELFPPSGKSAGLL
ncbi:MAG TPA: hypothetical protein VKG25_23355 [Bryobacteraceae bacterium]|nr:hypothetical protein [Bryobacteraceae bacterium]